MKGFFMKKIFKILKLLLIIIALLLSYKIFRYKDFNFDLLNNIYLKMKNHFVFSDNQINVSSFNKYVYLGDDKYKNESCNVYNIKDATVINCNASSVLVKYLDGYYGYYYNLVNVFVSKYDVIKNGDVISNYIDYFSFYFYKGEQRYTYEEIVGCN